MAPGACVQRQRQNRFRFDRVALSGPEPVWVFAGWLCPWPALWLWPSAVLEVGVHCESRLLPCARAGTPTSGCCEALGDSRPSLSSPCASVSLSRSQPVPEVAVTSRLLGSVCSWRLRVGPGFSEAQRTVTGEGSS